MNGTNVFIWAFIGLLGTGDTDLFIADFVKNCFDQNPV